VLVDFRERHDTRTNGQHLYTAANRRPTNEVSASQAERRSRPTRATYRSMLARISRVSGVSAITLRGNCSRGIPALRSAAHRLASDDQLTTTTRGTRASPSSLGRASSQSCRPSVCPSVTRTDRQLFRQSADQSTASSSVIVVRIVGALLLVLFSSRI